MTAAALGDRTLFPDLEPAVYLNHAAISPPSVKVREACLAVLEDYARVGVGAWMKYREQRDELRARLARIVGADTESIGLVASTSQGVVDIALCLPWKRGDRVVVFDGEFPTNVTPWQQAAALFGLEVVFHSARDFLQDESAAMQRLADELRRGVRLVAVSAVQFQSGLQMPLTEMSALCHEHGAEIFVDAMQAVGVVPFDVRELGLDYAAVGSHKWLMGVEGAGFLFIAPERIDALRPAIAAWLSHEDCASFLFEGEGHLRYDRPIRRRADFVEIGAMPAVGFAALGASVGLLEELGIDVIHRHVMAFQDRLEAGLVGLGCTSLRSADPARRSGILSVRPPAPHSSVTVWEKLRDRGVSCSVPDGVLRFSPHWPNDLGQVDEVLATVESVLESH